MVVCRFSMFGCYYMVILYCTPKLEIDSCPSIFLFNYCFFFFMIIMFFNYCFLDNLMLLFFSPCGNELSEAASWFFVYVS